MKGIIVGLLLLLAVPAWAEEYPFKVFAGANAVWFDGPKALPSDFELGATARASMTPHISAVGSLFYGLDNSYLRGSIGARITATDVADPNFSVGLGIQYQASSEPAIRPEEICPDVTIGWRPWAQTLPKIIVGGQGSYGLESNTASVLVAVRYELGTF